MRLDDEARARITRDEAGLLARVQDLSWLVAHGRLHLYMDLAALVDLLVSVPMLETPLLHLIMTAPVSTKQHAPGLALHPSAPVPMDRTRQWMADMAIAALTRRGDVSHAFAILKAVGMDPAAYPKLTAAMDKQRMSAQIRVCELPCTCVGE